MSKKKWFGVLMNSERIVHRKWRRKIAERVILNSDRLVPYDIFRAGAYSAEQAREECDGYNLSLEVRASGREATGNTVDE